MRLTSRENSCIASFGRLVVWLSFLNLYIDYKKKRIALALSRIMFVSVSVIIKLIYRSGRTENYHQFHTWPRLHAPRKPELKEFVPLETSDFDMSTFARRSRLCQS